MDRRQSGLPEGLPDPARGHDLISHGHFDHIHDAVPLAKKFAPEVVAIYETAHWLESKGVAKPAPMNKGGSQKVGDVTVTMTHAVHSCGILDDGKIIYGGEAAGYVLHLPDDRVLYFCRRHQRVLRHGADRAAIPSGAGLPADRRSVHDEPARGGARLPAAPPAQGDPDAFGTFPPLTGRPEDCRNGSADWKPKSGRWSRARPWNGRSRDYDRVFDRFPGEDVPAAALRVPAAQAGQQCAQK